MKILIVFIHEVEEIGHIDPEKPRTVHYVKDGMKYESSIKKSDYTVIEEIEIAQEEI